MADKIFEWKCPECGKIIKSIYPNQFRYNKEQHMRSHKKKEVKDNEAKKG